MNLGPIIATSLGIMLYRAVGEPLINRYLAWKHGPRIKVARRNWRGEYVPDLRIIRVERALWLALAVFVAFGCWVSWTILTTDIYRPAPKPLDPSLPPPIVSLPAPTSN